MTVLLYGNGQTRYEDTPVVSISGSSKSRVLIKTTSGDNISKIFAAKNFIDNIVNVFEQTLPSDLPEFEIRYEDGSKSPHQSLIKSFQTLYNVSTVPYVVIGKYGRIEQDTNFIPVEKMCLVDVEITRNDLKMFRYVGKTVTAVFHYHMENILQNDETLKFSLDIMPAIRKFTGLWKKRLSVSLKLSSDGMDEYPMVFSLIFDEGKVPINIQMPLFPPLQNIVFEEVDVPERYTINRYDFSSISKFRTDALKASTIMVKLVVKKDGMLSGNAYLAGTVKENPICMNPDITTPASVIVDKHVVARFLESMASVQSAFNQINISEIPTTQDEQIPLVITATTIGKNCSLTLYHQVVVVDQDEEQQISAEEEEEEMEPEFREPQQQKEKVDLGDKILYVIYPCQENKPNLDSKKDLKNTLEGFFENIVMEDIMCEYDRDMVQNAAYGKIVLFIIDPFEFYGMDDSDFRDLVRQLMKDTNVPLDDIMMVFIHQIKNRVQERSEVSLLLDDAYWLNLFRVGQLPTSNWNLTNTINLRVAVSARIPELFLMAHQSDIDELEKFVTFVGLQPSEKLEIKPITQLPKARAVPPTTKARKSTIVTDLDYTELSGTIDLYLVAKISDNSYYRSTLRRVSQDKTKLSDLIREVYPAIFSRATPDPDDKDFQGLTVFTNGEKMLPAEYNMSLTDLKLPDGCIVSFNCVFMKFRAHVSMAPPTKNIRVRDKTTGEMRPVDYNNPEDVKVLTTPQISEVMQEDVIDGIENQKLLFMFAYEVPSSYDRKWDLKTSQNVMDLVKQSQKQASKYGSLKVVDIDFQWVPRNIYSYGPIDPEPLIKVVCHTIDICNKWKEKAEDAHDRGLSNQDFFNIESQDRNVMDKQIDSVEQFRQIENVFADIENLIFVSAITPDGIEQRYFVKPLNQYVLSMFYFSEDRFSYGLWFEDEVMSRFVRIIDNGTKIKFSIIKT